MRAFMSCLREQSDRKHYIIALMHYDPESVAEFGNMNENCNEGFISFAIAPVVQFNIAVRMKFYGIVFPILECFPKKRVDTKIITSYSYFL